MRFRNDNEHDRKVESNSEEAVDHFDKKIRPLSPLNHRLPEITGAASESAIVQHAAEYARKAVNNSNVSPIGM